MTDVEIDLPLEADELRDLSSRVTAVAIALITLLAAAVGFLHATAVRQGGAAEVEAQRLGVQAFGVLVEAETQAQLELGAFAASVEDTAMRWSLVQQAHAGNATDRAALLAEAETWAELAAIGAGRTSIADDPRYAPEGDLAFPQRFLTERSRDGFVLSARQDAVVEYGSAWGARAGAYTAILAVLAVSVYLLGMSMTVPGRRARQTFVAVGAVMAVGGAGWALINWLSPPVRAPDAAAEYFADGRVAQLTATTQEEYAAAAAEFTDAIALRPTFGQAYVNRANATIYAGSPQLGAYLSLTSPEAVRAGRDDLRRAMALGIETRRVVGNLGFYSFLIGLEAGSGDELDEGIRLTRQAIRLDETQSPTSRAAPAQKTGAPSLLSDEALTGTDLALIGNLAVALLASRQDTEAAEAYDTFIGGLSAIDPVTKERLLTQTAIYLASGAMTDLELLLIHQPDLLEQVDALKARIAGAVGQAPADSAPTATIHATDAEVVFPAGLQFEVELEDIGDTDYLSVYWYRSAPDGTGWHVLPEVSGPLWYLDTQGELDMRDGEDGRYHYLAPLIETSWPRRCIEGGDYRGELYLNGRRVDVVESTAEWGRLQPYLFRELGVAMCGPSDWVRLSDREVGHSDGFVSPDGSRGALVMRMAATGQSLEDTLSDALERDGVPRELEQTAEVTPDFLDLPSRLRRDYAYDGGLVLAMVGFVPEENVHLVLVVFGPEEWWDEPAACRDEERPAGAACEPLNIVDSARSFDFAPSGDDVPVDPGAGDPTFGVVSFGTEVGVDNLPLDEVQLAPSGTTLLCGFWEYGGMSATSTWAAHWYVDGTEVEGATIPEDVWPGGPSGNWYACIGDSVSPLADGAYELALDLDGELLRSNSLFVGGDHPIVTFELINESGVDVCGARLSLATAKNWGPDELADLGTLRDGETRALSVPAGTYDLQATDCDGGTLVEDYGIVIEGVTTAYVVELPD
jgi:hypothetical protein